jgi:hypothetical protein
VNAPVLARTFEDAGLATILVTNMPFWAERKGAPRTLAVEFPFGHALGAPHNLVQQMTVIRQGLRALETATEAGTVVHSPEAWPVASAQATQDWQPAEPSPLMKAMAPQFLQMMREARKGKGSP